MPTAVTLAAPEKRVPPPIARKPALATSANPAFAAAQKLAAISLSQAFPRAGPTVSAPSVQCKPVIIEPDNRVRTLDAADLVRNSCIVLLSR